ncbi:hypothetical protein MIR68_012672, partial [Amoeboaphelidium protococcarum]
MPILTYLGQGAAGVFKKLFQIGNEVFSHVDTTFEAPVVFNDSTTFNSTITAGDITVEEITCGEINSGLLNCQGVISSQDIVQVMNINGA